MKVADLYDLAVAGDDLAFGPDGEPRSLSGADVVAQDVRHRLRASGLPPGLLGAGAQERPRLLAALAREAEEDERIRPGTARAAAPAAGPAAGAGQGRVRITARTTDGNTIEA